MSVVFRDEKQLDLDQLFMWALEEKNERREHAFLKVVEALAGHEACKRENEFLDRIGKENDSSTTAIQENSISPPGK